MKRGVVPTLLIPLMVMVSCAKEENQLIMASPIVSLKKSKGPSEEYQKDRYVQFRWCQGEKVFIEEESKQNTLLEQVLAKAHAKTKSPYFLNATFYQESVNSADWTYTGWNPCVTMRGHTVKKVDL